MSHGGVESTRGSEGERNLPPARPKADDFGREVSKIAVAQICESVGYQGFKESALDALSDIAIKYLRDLGKIASSHANLAGRTECNLFDIIRSLEDLGVSQGFSGTSEIGNCSVGSGTVKEIIEFIDSEEEIPFAQPVSYFPVIRDRKMIPSFEHMGEIPPGKHIPTWLPALPDPHTYVQTPMWNERASDPRSDKIEQAKQRRKAERALLSLQQRLVCNGLTRSSVLEDPGDGKDDQQEAGTNPFLATPLQPGKKDVSQIVLPAKLSEEAMNGNEVSVLKAFAPAIEAVRGSFSDDGDGEKKLLPEKRPAINFKFRTGKKLLGESLDLNIQKKDGRRTAIFLRDDERDDKKRRAEFILRQSIENPLDLNQS
ncbi:hypothetical protein SLEP1_g48532 [Rubroshorea leprosula]|uniref:Transcription initiation factor TFIID subunit 8 n=1 Tax=Rubroshorea leprosula TaxID=152421 RepID=A0AAV5LWS7_9ROSI|nr:hypothetical protein SLEP1_g48532 [Rubroshorea leprosula]